MDLIKVLSKELKLQERYTANAVALLDEGNTIPFIARYRKEMTGAMDEEVLRNLLERLNYLRNLEKRREEVIHSIEEQEKMTPELLEGILQAETMTALEDLYRPYRPKRRTRATIAREKGLEPLAMLLFNQETESPDKAAQEFINPDLEVNSAEEALQGAMDIVAEIVAEQPEYRRPLKSLVVSTGFVRTKGEEGDHNYLDYLDYREPVEKIPSHRILAINRGEKEKFLNVKIELEDKLALKLIKEMVIGKEPHPTAEYLQMAIEDGYRRLLFPSIEREIRNELTERAEKKAIDVFAKNLRQLLMQPPIKGKVFLGLDPAYRTGCKLAVVDSTGKVLYAGVIYPTPPQNDYAAAAKVLDDLVEKYGINAVAIGNGTASREAEKFIAEFIRERGKEIEYTIVSEAGASVYSASKLAKEEFPNLDVSYRGAISIARRVQDPLAELVKIDPKAIGVGQYQHDVNQNHLSQTLNGVVEDCVNAVGVDLNTASFSLLSYVSGINKRVAKNIVAWREGNGRFTNRRELLKVSGLGEKAFEQCAGFLRIVDGDEPLDNTSVHPESYAVARKLKDFDRQQLSQLLKDKKHLNRLTEGLGIGELTLKDIIMELIKPGRDPRDELPKPVFRSDVLELKDLREGMILTGTVRNIVDFGAFVDIGVHQDGLVHISQMADKYIRHPLDVVNIGDNVKVRIISIDEKRGRIGLSMKES